MHDDHQLARVKGLPSDMTASMLKQCRWCDERDLHLSEEGFVRCMTCIAVCSCVKCYEGVRDKLDEASKKFEQQTEESQSPTEEDSELLREESASPLMSPSSVLKSIRKNENQILQSTIPQKPTSTWIYLECPQKGCSYKRRFLSATEDKQSIQFRSSSNIKQDTLGSVILLRHIIDVSDCVPSSQRLAKLGVCFSIKTINKLYTIIIPTGYSSWRAWLSTKINNKSVEL